MDMDSPTTCMLLRGQLDLCWIAVPGENIRGWVVGDGQETASTTTNGRFVVLPTKWSVQKRLSRIGREERSRLPPLPRTPHPSSSHVRLFSSHHPGHHHRSRPAFKKRVDNPISFSTARPPHGRLNRTRGQRVSPRRVADRVRVPNSHDPS